jgi:uncharacterized protein with HEPN domain
VTERSVEPHLRDILEAIDGIEQTVAGASLADFAASWQMRRAVERGIEIVSEASRHLPADVKAKHPEVPWTDIAGIGNILRHEYQRVEDAITWNVATRRLAELRRVVEAMLRAG